MGTDRHKAPNLEIFIPFYKGKEFLALAIASVMEQNRPAKSITILDDHSPEIFGPEDVNSSSVSFNYIRHPENLGMVANWNYALDSAEELALLLHADDRLKPTFISTFIKCFEGKADGALYFCKAEIIDENNRVVFSFPDFVKKILSPKKDSLCLSGEEAVIQLLKGNFIFCPTIVYNLRVLDGTRFDDRWKMVQDLDFMIRVLESGKAIIGIDEVAYQYRRHSSNATSQYTQNLLRFREENSLYLELAQRFADRGWLNASKVARKRTIIKLNLGYCAIQDAFRFRIRDFSSKIKLFWELFI